MRKARRILQQEQDAQDVVQAVFVDLWQRGEREPTLPLLYRAVTNRCLNLLRDQRNRERLLAQHDPILRGPVRTTFQDAVVGLDVLTKAAQRLDAQSLEVLVYRYFDDMALEEIATLMGIDRKTVSKRLQQAHATIARLLGKAEGPT